MLFRIPQIQVLMGALYHRHRLCSLVLQGSIWSLINNTTVKGFKLGIKIVQMVFDDAFMLKVQLCSFSFKSTHTVQVVVYIFLLSLCLLCLLNKHLLSYFCQNVTNIEVTTPFLYLLSTLQPRVGSFSNSFVNIVIHFFRLYITVGIALTQLPSTFFLQ